MIPYNPSSFNSNKTILEQIIELQNWLKEHPQYRIYCSSENGATLQVTYTLSNVTDNTDMDTGDVVLFANGTIASVTSVDRDNNTFNVAGLQSIVGPQGPSGPEGYSLRVSSDNYVNDSTAYSRANLEPSHGTRQGDTIIFANGELGIVTSISGADFYVSSRTLSMKGPQGVSITNVVIDASGHLIVTLSDGNTIDAGSVVTGTGVNIIQLTQYTGTLSADDLAIVNDPTQECIIDYYENSKHSFYFKDRQITGGWRFSNIDYVTGSHITIMWHIEIDSTTGAYLQDYTQSFIRAENMNSYGATSGQVLTADGSNGASWQTPSGSSPEIVTISGSSGTLVGDNLTKIQSDNCIIYHSGDDRYYRKGSLSSGTYIYYYDTSYANSSIAYANMIEIKKVGGQWTKSSGTIRYKPIASTIDSQTATSGQVLTADGNGNASWQTPSGGTFDHYVQITTESSGTISLTDIPKLQHEDSLLIWYDGNNYHYYTKFEETSSTISFNNTFRTNGITQILINKSDGTYSKSYYKFRSSAIDSQTATNGQVLTADGNGNASWQTPSGGTTLNKYTANITGNASGYLLMCKILENAKSISNITNTWSNIPCTFGIYSSQYIKISGTSCDNNNLFVGSWVVNHFDVNNATLVPASSYSWDGSAFSQLNATTFVFSVTYYNDSEIL